MVTIRSAVEEDAEAIASCHIAAWRDTYRPIVAEEYLNNLSLETHTAKWTTKIQQPQCHTLVAAHEQVQVVGFINGGPERTGRTDFGGEIYSIYILKDWRRQGIGRRLLGRFATALLETQITSLIVWALQGNEYRYCYAAWGGHEIAVEPIKIGEQELIEVAYGWQDIRVLLESG
ncbi:MAG TPA: GNAT family N-acetyltransferase [Pirellulales bacterium]|jgi:GNAT superfamily N-acetyltransferase|nr:GNAT family N-acetyltransferase [Pirellulales bacterium]